MNNVENKVDNTFQPIKVLNLPPKKVRLGKAEKEILKDITLDFLTFDEIVDRRQCSKEAVYKIIRRLKQKGLITGSFQSVESVESTNLSDNTFSNKMRLHAQEFNIKIISKTNKYFQSKQRGNTIQIDGNTIRLFNDSIEIYSGQSFFEKDEQTATGRSLAYWNRFIARLEHELGVVLIKPRVQNITLVNQHYAETNSDIAKDCLDKKEKIKIITLDDGKVWFTIDNSWNLKERECIHPETAKQDSEAVSKQLNDWRLNNPPTNSEISDNLNKASQIVIKNQELLIGLPAVIDDLRKQIKSHLSLIKEYRKENRIWRKDIETKYISQSKNNQSKLGDFI